MANKIRICHIAESVTGGVFTHLRQLAERLDPTTFEQSFVLSGAKRSELKTWQSFYGHPLKVVNMKRNIDPWSDLVCLFKLIRILTQGGFDIVHCHSSKAGVIGRIAASVLRKPVVYTPHSFAFSNPEPTFSKRLYTRIERIMVPLTTNIVCVSKGEYELALDCGVASTDKLVVIENGVASGDLSGERDKSEWLKQRSFLGSERIIGFVGRLEYQKNPEMLIQALGQLRDVPCIVVVVGDGSLRDSLVNLVSRLRVEDKVLFMGNVDHMEEIYEVMDLLVCTSKWEGLPYAVLEAASHCVPIIATSIPGVRDIIMPGVTGTLVDVNSVDSLVQAIKYIMHHGSKAVEMADNARKLVKQSYSINGMVDKLEILYKDVVLSSLGERRSHT